MGDKLKPPISHISKNSFLLNPLISQIIYFSEFTLYLNNIPTKAYIVYSCFKHCFYSFFLLLIVSCCGNILNQANIFPYNIKKGGSFFF